MQINKENKSESKIQFSNLSRATSPSWIKKIHCQQLKKAIDFEAIKFAIDCYS